MKIKSVNPSTEEVIAEYDIAKKDEIEQAVANARKAFGSWKEMPLAERAKYVKRFGKKLLMRKQDYAELMAKEMGKPVKEGLPEVEKCAWLCEYYGRNAKRFLKEDRVATEYTKSYVTFEPLGIVASIMPWNFPFWQPLRFAIPAIIAGNVLMLKHSSTVPGCATAIDDLFKKCRFPENVFQAVIGDANAGTHLIESSVDVISVTGSSETGSRIAQTAMKGLKKVVLELGGNDPFVILADANIEKAAAGAVTSRFLNCGQSCIAAKRFIVMKTVAEEFTQKFIEKTKQLKVGDPLNPETDMGPLVNQKQRESLEGQIGESVAAGAKILLGGKRAERKGFFYEPTILGNVNNGMRIAKEEAFGPAAPIIVVENEEEALRVANDTEYGLGASIWTDNLDKGEQLTRKISSGLVFVNKGVRSDPRLPFGGVKKSGIGRELSRYGLMELVNIKTVVVN